MGSIIDTYASKVRQDPAARQVEAARLQKMYGNDPLRILYAGICASGGVPYYNGSEIGEVQEVGRVRADMAAYLIINPPAALDPHTKWRLMEKSAPMQDNAYVLMLLEAGLSPLPPEKGQRTALMMFAEKATATGMKQFVARLPEANREFVVNALDGAGRNAVHFATHNTNPGVMAELKAAGADMDVVHHVKGRDPKRAAHMAVLAGNFVVAEELVKLAPHQFQASPACPVTPHELAETRIGQMHAQTPQEVGISKGRKNPMERDSRPAHVDNNLHRTMRIAAAALAAPSVRPPDQRLGKPGANGPV